jgi:hypothetical protein
MASQVAKKRTEEIENALSDYLPFVNDLNILRSKTDTSNRGLYNELVSKIFVDLPKKLGRSRLISSEHIIILTPETGGGGGLVMLDTSRPQSDHTYDNFTEGVLGKDYINGNLNVKKAHIKLTNDDTNINVTFKNNIEIINDLDNTSCLLRFSTVPSAPYGYLIYTKKNSYK